MSEVRIAAEPRTEFGKGAARRIRRADKVPAVLYGHGTAPRHIALPGHELMLALKHANVLLTLELEGGTELALPKDVQRDPVKGYLEHVDLVVVKRGEKVVVDLPVVTVGDAPAGGLLTVEHNTVQVEAEATHIPQSVEVDLSALQLGAHVTAGQLALPEGTTLVTDPEALVLAVSAAPAPEAEGEAAPEAAEGEEPSEAPAAPAEGAEG